MNATIAIIIAAVSFSFYPLLCALALETTSNYLLAMILQILTPMISFGVLIYHLGSFGKAKNLLQTYFKLPWDIQIIPFLSGTGIYAGAIFFIFALEMMSKAGATLVMECWPLMAIIVARALLTRKKWDNFRLLDILLICITFTGLTLISASEANLTVEEVFTSPLNLFANNTMEEVFGLILALLAALCFAWGGVSRSYFVTLLSDDFRKHYFKKTDSIAESNFTYMMTYILGVPASILCFLLFEENLIQFSSSVLIPIMLLPICLIVMATLYAYAILIARNANINLLWYIAPVLATIWLVLFGYSQITPLLIFGGFLIILSNIILILTNKKEVKEVPS